MPVRNDHDEPTPLQIRREEEKEKRRQSILNAAERVIAKKGWEDTHFGEIAKLTRLSRSLVYVYFPTKEDLFHAICERGLAIMENRFRAVVREEHSGLDQLLAIGLEYYAFSREEPLYFSLQSQFQAQEATETANTGVEAEAHLHGKKCLEMVARALGKGVADGSIRPSIGDPGVAALSIWAFTHGLILIASKKGAMLEKDFGLTSPQMMDEGFRLLRSSLSSSR